MAGLLGEREVQAHHVGTAQQLVERQQLHAQLLGPRLREVGVVRGQFHAEGSGQPRDVGPDPTQTDDAHRLAPQLRAGEAPAVPVPRPHTRRRERDLAEQREQQSERVLRRTHGVRARRVEHGDPPPGRRQEVDVVDPGAGPSDDAQAGRPSH